MSDSRAVQVSSQPVFNFGEHSVRVVVREGEPWFVASDVCAALDYKNTSKAVGDHLDDDERTTALVPRTHNDSLGVPTNIINESGLYALVLRSRKPEARKFAKWVTSEVLPAIRKTGIYVGKPFTVNPGDVLTAEEQNTLRLMLKTAVERLPKEKQAGAMVKGWSKLKAHFGVPYREIPRQEFSEAVSIIARHTAEWELVEEGPKSCGYNFPLKTADVHDRQFGNTWFTPERLMDGRNRAPELELIQALEKDGYDVAGAKIRIVALHEAMGQCIEMRAALMSAARLAEQIHNTTSVAKENRGKNVLFDGAPNPNCPIDRHVYRSQMVPTRATV